MTRFTSHLWIMVAVLTLALVAWLGNEGSRASVQTQEAERVLEIERYPNEPLELVSVRIGAQNVRDRIKTKFKDNKSHFGIDSVKFKEKDHWYERVAITLRNITDKPVYGVQGFLFFKPVGFPMIFSLQLTAAKELRHQPFEPGAELELTVTPGMLNHTLEDMKLRGADVSQAVVSFSLDAVIFSDQLQWYRGKLLRPDSEFPGKWVPVDQPLAKKSNQPLATTASFVRASFKPAAPVGPQTSKCKDYNDSFIGITCSGGPADCIKRLDQDTLTEEGVFSMANVSGLCIWAGSGSGSCSNTTTHQRMQIDPSCEEIGIEGYGGTSFCDIEVPPSCSDSIDNDGDLDIDQNDSGCICPSPIVIDTLGNGFDLSTARNGVRFDIAAIGRPLQIAWIQGDDAWLILDRNGNGTVDNGGELFGNYTPQPPSSRPHGFLALAEYDKPQNGGNGDGRVGPADAVFSSLRLWQDANRNGISEPGELHQLSAMDVVSIDLDYRTARRTDLKGNLFRYRAKVYNRTGSGVGRWAWDVFLSSAP